MSDERVPYGYSATGSTYSTATTHFYFWVNLIHLAGSFRTCYNRQLNLSLEYEVQIFFRLQTNLFNYFDFR